MPITVVKKNPRITLPSPSTSITQSYLEKTPPKTKPNYSLDELDLIRSVCRGSFYRFVKEFWGEICQEKPHWNWHIKVFCDTFQALAERVFLGLPKDYDYVVNVPPGTTKSTVFSIMSAPWVWTRMPTCQFICGSYTEDLALDLSLKSRDIIMSEKYREYFPDIVLREDQNTKTLFKNTKGGWRHAVGVGTSVVGKHAHIQVVDDPVDPTGAVSDAELETVERWISRELSQRKVNKAITPLLLVEQRLAQHDPAGNLLERNSPETPVYHLCLPAEVSERVKPPEMKANYDVDGLLDPVRLNKPVLARALKDLGEYGYAGQFDQNPVPEGGGMFKWKRIKVVSAANLPKKWRVRCRYWDKAATKGGGAYTVGALCGIDLERNFWIIDIIRDRWDTWEREKCILSTARLDGRDVLIGLEQEGGSGGKESAQATTRRLIGYRVRVNKPTGNKGSSENKKQRADPFSVQVNNGSVFMVSAPWNKEYLKEMEFFPFSKYKDQIDASSGSFTVCTTRNFHAGVI